MSMIPLPFRSALASYEAQAEDLLARWRAGDADATQTIRREHPHFLDERVSWLPRQMSEVELREIPLTLDDALLAVARRYSFRDWSSLSEWVLAVRRDDSPVAWFESAVEAVIAGDERAVERLLSEHPELVQARSTIVTPHEPPKHGATLLHYIAANGVEGYRQKTPSNAVEIARRLLRAGAEPDGLAGMYGGQHTTMSMLVSSVHPAKAGVQVALVETLLDFGAAVDGRGSGDWVSPLMTALAFGYLDAAQALVRRGATINSVAAAAGLGLTQEVRQLLATSDSASRHKALALAAQHGHNEVLRLLIDAGEDLNRYNPEGNHSHSTPLHQAVWSDHEETVRLLVENGARLDIRDTLWDGTPLGWAEHGGRTTIAEFLRAERTSRESLLP